MRLVLGWLWQRGCEISVSVFAVFVAIRVQTYCTS